MELTELIKDYVATELLSSQELDFLEGELWETLLHIAEINTLTIAPRNICKKLNWPTILAGIYVVQLFLILKDHRKKI